MPLTLMLRPKLGLTLRPTLLEDIDRPPSNVCDRPLPTPAERNEGGGERGGRDMTLDESLLSAPDVAGRRKTDLAVTVVETF